MAKARSGAHTAGIYADLTLDGPEIGTLVVIIDRAKNLPNRKTMGKQDPYCAARLGKEAKKTETDRRGGQTPKWDQEIRFTVHDSPDYTQLKVSVFNDDKKTELIGETWIVLDQIVVPGGGTSDLWHKLNCKGRYAGDIRIELTYYDTRPKTEKSYSNGMAVPGFPDFDEWKRKAPLGWSPHDYRSERRREWMRQNGISDDDNQGADPSSDDDFGVSSPPLDDDFGVSSPPLDDEEGSPPPPPPHWSVPTTPADTRIWGSVPPSLIPGYGQHPLNSSLLDPALPSSYAEAWSPAAQLRQRPGHQPIKATHGRESHRYSAPVQQYSSPVSKPQAGTSPRQIPVRKSLSPSPAPTGRAQQPFSPDSFQAYNPSISSPEKAQDHARQEKLGDGLIIGSDGRVIDPSDHLPTDTWAPEPEPKIPKRTPQKVTVKFRTEHHDAKPKPPAGRRPLIEGRTQSTSAPNFDSYSPRRNRPQPSPRVSAGNIPPPVPSKLPMGGGKEDWGDALSEEIQKINIGSGRRMGHRP